MIFETNDGYYYSTSPDLLTWTLQDKIFSFPGQFDHPQPNDVWYAYQTLISPEQENERTTSRSGYLYYAKRENYSAECQSLYRRPFSFNSVPATPTATPSSTATPAQIATPTPTATALPTPAPVPAALSFAPKALTFPTQTVLGGNGSTSGTKSVRILNVRNRRQNAPIEIISLRSNDPEFNASSACVGTLQSGTGCQVAITFTPNQTGERRGNLMVTSNSTNPVVAVLLRGVGSPGKIGMTPKKLNFGRVALGLSVQKPIALHNRNPIPMGIGACDNKRQSAVHAFRMCWD